MKNNASISGSSLLEAVIAIAIISGCLTVGLGVFVRVTNVQPPVDFYTMDSKLKQEIALHTDTLGLLNKQQSESNLFNQNNTSQTENGLEEQSLVIVHKSDTLRFQLFEFKALRP